MIVRWGLGSLEPLLAELGIVDPLLVTSERFAALELSVERRFSGVRRHAPRDAVDAATHAASGADGLVGLGGGSAIDVAKAVSSAAGLPLVAVPTTYAGAEWTPYFGIRDEQRRAKTGGSGANTVAVIYEPELTLEIPRDETVGSALNALAHAAEALYGGPCADASEAAALIAAWLPRVVTDGRDLDARTRLLEGAMHAGMALAQRGLFLGHALAQGLGGRYGLPHGALNALCLPAALRFNAPVVPAAIEALAEAMGVEDGPGRVEELARLGGFVGLRDLGIPEEELASVAAEIAERPAARANPRAASPADVEELLRSIW